MQSLYRCFIVVLAVNLCALIFIYLVVSFHQMPDIFLVEESCQPTSTIGNDNVKLILFWTPYFQRADFAWGYGRRPFISNDCQVDTCETTSDRNRLSDADAIVFHIRDLNPFDLPSVRRTCQRWIFFLMETPLYTGLNLSPFHDFFNWTFTYRFDSDIPPRIQLIPKNVTSSIEATMINHASGKTRLAVWLVSNCHTYSHRENYVKELRKYVPIDVYGDCSEMYRDNHQEEDLCMRKTSLRQCYRSFEKRYKFYLSFENSLCQDYFSEKLYNIYDHDMVPVVLGKVDYVRFTPPHSLVDASTFATPADLADFLKHLDTDDDAYNAYFVWKRNWTFAINTNPWCDVCAKLNDLNGPPTKVYPDIERWWVVEGNCTNDVVGKWKISSFWDSIVDNVYINWGSLKHRTNLYVKSLATH